jgi:hypothetical protein
MQKIIIVTLWVALATALPFIRKAQDTSTIEKLQRYVVESIDKSQVPTGFLEHYGAPFVPLPPFNGALSDSNDVAINLWRLLYFQLQTSYCQNGQNPLPSIIAVNSTIAANNNSTAIPIALLLGQYAQIKDDAYSNNLLNFNNSNHKIYDVANRSQSPYQTEYLFAAAPLKSYDIPSTVSFVFNTNLVWANTGLSINQLQVNFDNGNGFVTLPANSPVSVSFTDSGFKRFTIKATLSNSQVVQCYSSYYVVNNPSNNSNNNIVVNSYNPSGTNGPTIPTWGNIAPVQGVHSGAVISIVYSSKQRASPYKLRKPLIIVENMDAYTIAPQLQKSS